jgi:predicted NUDIX family NTP pyrophosphohydrolase
MQWPPKSGTYQCFPEVDRASGFDLQTARGKIHKGRARFLGRLVKRLGFD